MDRNVLQQATWNQDDAHIVTILFFIKCNKELLKLVNKNT